ncbi:MAG TPA: hypothetical protein VEV17_22055, partial [Bryobacteraceae bacterium]|nr:hypothetical protein [Bryobacteraceae bacterium]
GSLRLVMAFQLLSQFMDIESVFVEVKRVLAPGGVFLFAEEPMKRLLTLGLYRCPYYDTMKPWERQLYNWGLLGYLVRDVVGAHQEESFGIRQNHSLGLKDWHRLVRAHFADAQYEMFVPHHGWGERVAKRIAVRLDPYRSEWRAARVLGGTLAAMCRKAGEPAGVHFNASDSHRLLRCPDCHEPFQHEPDGTLRCTACTYRAPNEDGVYNLLPSRDRAELYPGDREDVIDFCLPGHGQRLLEGWHELEGVFGNKYRWIGEHAAARLVRVKPGPQRLRIRGHAGAGHSVQLSATANGQKVGSWKLDRSGLFIVEADLPDSAEYRIDIHAGPAWQETNDRRTLTVNLSMIRLVPRE